MVFDRMVICFGDYCYIMVDGQIMRNESHEPGWGGIEVSDEVDQYEAVDLSEVPEQVAKAFKA